MAEERNAAAPPEAWPRATGSRDTAPYGRAGGRGWPILKALWFAAGALLLVIVAVAALSGPEPGAGPATRDPPARSAAPRPAPPSDLVGDLATLRAAVLAEQARLAALVEARRAVEAEVEALRREAEARRALAAATDPLTDPAAPEDLPLPPPFLPPPAAAPDAVAAAYRVFIHHRGTGTSEAAAAEAAQQMRDAGFGVAGLR
jgi:hypothetical protein